MADRPPPAAAEAPRRVLLKLSGEALMGDARVRDRPGRGRARSPARWPMPASDGTQVGDRRRRREHLPRAGGQRAGHGPLDRRLHGHAGDGDERARHPGRARAGRPSDPRDERHRDERDLRAVHPAPRRAAPREGAGRRHGRRHRQPVLHDGHRGHAAGGRGRTPRSSSRRPAWTGCTMPTRRTHPGRAALRADRLHRAAEQPAPGAGRDRRQPGDGQRDADRRVRHDRPRATSRGPSVASRSGR